jgi:hypothetical protein
VTVCARVCVGNEHAECLWSAAAVSTSHELFIQSNRVKLKLYLLCPNFSQTPGGLVR